MNSILDILHCLFVSFSLAVAALQCWAGDKISVLVGFDHHWQGQVPHPRIIEDDRAWRLLVSHEILGRHRARQDWLVRAHAILGIQILALIFKTRSCMRHLSLMAFVLLLSGIPGHADSTAQSSFSPAQNKKKP